MNKSVFSVRSGINNIDSDRAGYWRRKSPAERLAAIEELRELNYGYDSTTARLQRVFEITELKKR
jgi:hypothetical protein